MTGEENIIRVLLVEDNELNQKFAMAVVRKMGFAIDVAPNGKIGVELFKSKNYHLVLMDIQMPEMNGIEATMEIRRIEAEEGQGKHVPIIAATAFAMEQDKRNCINAGMDEFIAKPYKPFELEQKIRMFL